MPLISSKLAATERNKLPAPTMHLALIKRAGALAATVTYGSMNRAAALLATSDDSLSHAMALRKTGAVVLPEGCECR
jgi:hypothetical protein